MHLKRWITGLTALPFLVLLIFKGGPFWFAMVISLVCILALGEYFHIVLKTGENNRELKAESEKRKTIGFSVFSFQALAFITSMIIIWAAYKNSFKIASSFF